MKNIVNIWLMAALLVGAAVPKAQAQSPRLDPSFALTSATGRPPNYGAYIKDMVFQPDGKLVVAGDFIALNGRPVTNIARLLPDGQVDTTFAAPLVDGEIASLVLQADGKLLVAGRFTTVGGQSRVGIARLLPNGNLDPNFLSPFGGGPLPLYAYSNVEKMVMQPGRGILVIGFMIPIVSTGMRGFSAARLLEATGALDPTFQPGFDTDATYSVLVQPSGQLIFAGRPHLIGGQQCTVWATLPDGALASAFVPLPEPNPLAQDFGLAHDSATGKFYVVRRNFGTGLDYEPVRLLPTGVRDPTFSTTGVFPGLRSGAVNSVAVQPNGRLLLGGGFPTGGGGFFGSARLLSNGVLDPSYDPSNGPTAYVGKVLVQPDGALLFAGDFAQAGGFALNCLARMLDPNVLSARASGPAAAAVEASPVPAHDVLHLRLPAARVARQVALLDALGRVVLRQAVPAGQSAPVLPTAGLPPGGYLLRVDFADGPPAYRRVAVE